MAHGDMAFDGKQQGTHECVCGAMVPFTVAQLKATFLTLDPPNPGNRGAQSVGLPPCPQCGSQTFLNLNLPPDHPHPAAKHIERLHGLLGSPKEHL